MKTGLVAILLDVVAPTDLTGVFVNGIEAAGTGAKEDRIACDRRDMGKSAVGFQRPLYLRS